MKNCNCLFEVNEHREGNGKCPYGSRAEMPHPDFVRRSSVRANAWLDAICSFEPSLHHNLLSAVRSSERKVLKRIKPEDMRGILASIISAVPQ